MVTEKLILDTDRIIYESENKIRIAEEKAKKAEKREENAKLEVAKNMLSMGMTIEQIKNATELPLSKIKRLQKKK